MEIRSEKPHGMERDYDEVIQFQFQALVPLLVMLRRQVCRFQPSFLGYNAQMFHI